MPSFRRTQVCLQEEKNRGISWECKEYEKRTMLTTAWEPLKQKQVYREVMHSG
jgi:hypothetical protein